MANQSSVRVEIAADAEKFGALIRGLNLTPPVLVKPNWGTVECYTEADILDWTLAAIEGEKLVIESHGWARNEETLLGKPQGALTKANLRRGDRWFRESTGIQAVLEKHQVEFLNLTEEVWAGRTADPAQVRDLVEARFAPVAAEEMYARVPERLFALRGGSILSLTKHKLVFYPLGVSFSVKNLFGLVPGPSRGKYHGQDHVLLAQSIVDINKIYRSLFALKGVIEAVHIAGNHAVETERMETYPGSGQVFAGEDTLTLDAYAAALAGRDPNGIDHLRLAARTFGGWDEQAVAAAVSASTVAAG
jgi:uncharacterized protein (DUF362 family)